MTWSTAWKIAWREAWASRVKFFFVVLAVAVGVGALTGVRGFSSAFRRMLLKEARTLMAGDISARQFIAPTPAQQSMLEALGRDGVRYTWLTETITMAASEKASDPLLVSIKAVDPTAYPFYGELVFEPKFHFGADEVAVSQDLLIRLNASVGESLKIGGESYRIGAVVVKEPDRMTGTLNIGPRLMMSRAALDRADLIRAGGRASQRYLFKLPATIGVDQMRQRLKAAFPEALIIDFRETHPLLTRGLDRSTTFLSLVSLMALIIGAIGVAMAIHAHLQQRLDSIAIMKCLGARASSIMRIYVLQTLALGLIGGLAGAAVGAVVQSAFPLFIARYFPIPPDFALDWGSVWQGLAIAVLMTVLFTLPPLLGIREVRPISILRRDVQTNKVRFQWRTAATGLAVLIGVGAVAGSLTLGTWADALRLGLYFTGGLLVSLGLLYLVAWILLKLIRRVYRGISLQLPTALRHGLANLDRPGSQARTVLVALGIGVMFTLTVYLLQKQMIGQLSASAPPGMPNVFLFDVQQSQRDGLVKLLKAQRGVAGEPEISPSVAVRITRVNGQPVEAIPSKSAERFRTTRSVTWRRRPPDWIEITSGAWTATPDAVAISESAARGMSIRPGARLDLTAAGRDFSATVSCVYKTESVRVGSGMEFMFQPEKLAGLPVVFFGGVRVAPAQVAKLQRASYQAYPTVTVVNIADVLEIVQGVIDQIAIVVRFISAFAILAGVIILASAVAGTRFRRVRETVILKTLGGTRARIARIGARFAEVVAAAVQDSGLEGARVVGNPVRRSLAGLDRAALRGEARSAFGLRAELPTLVVVGGSSGAAHFNEVFASVAPELAAAGVQVLHAHGRGKTLNLADPHADTAAVPYVGVEYIARMDLAYAAADLLVTRSGAMTVAEIGAVRAPVVYVPLAFGNGEQALNAKDQVDAGAARLIPDAELTRDAVLTRVLPLVTDPAALRGMERAASGSGTAHADEVLARIVLAAARMHRARR